MNMPNIQDDLITRYLCGEASPTEAMILEEWIELSFENKRYFEEMQLALSIVVDKQIPKVDSQKAWSTFVIKTQKPRTIYYLAGLAATLALGLMAALFLMLDRNTEINTNDQIVNQSLPDESMVTLSSFSSIKYDADFGKKNRKVNLTGSAKFTVKHDENLPFIIDANGVYLEDLGTTFTVESKPGSDTLFLVVTGGIVRLYDEFGNEIVVKAGEKAWYIRSVKKIITDVDTEIVKFDFKDTRLIDVVTLLNDAYNIDIVLSPTQIGECKITTQFFDEEIATIVNILTETLGFKYQYQDHRYTIEGKPCL